MAVKHMGHWTRAQLLLLPRRQWDLESEYDSVLLLSTRRAHDSGWATMVVVGVRDQAPVEIACAVCDDISWQLPLHGPDISKQLRMDCVLKSGAFHAWAPWARFLVRAGLSSLTIELFSNL